MKFSVDAIVIPDGVYSLCEGAVAGALVFHSDRTLVAASWDGLRSAGTSGPFVVDETATASVVATDVGIDTAWTIGGTDRSRVYVARSGALEVVDLGVERSVSRVRVARLEARTFAAAVDAGCRNLLLVVERPVNPDFSEYALAAVEPASGGLTLEAGGCGLIDLQAEWSTHLASWVIGATTGGAIWRWDGSGPKVSLADPSPVVHASNLVCDEAGIVHATRLTESTHGDTLLTNGLVGPQGVQWSPPVNAGPGLTYAVRSPARPLWACLSGTGADQVLQLRDASGALVAEAGGSTVSRLDRLYWSRFDVDRLWGIGLRTLAALTIEV